MPLKFGIAVHIAAAGVAAAANIAVIGVIAVEVRAAIDRLPQRSAPKADNGKPAMLAGFLCRPASSKREKKY